jgi:hypothetical protein
MTWVVDMAHSLLTNALAEHTPRKPESRLKLFDGTNGEKLG